MIRPGRDADVPAMAAIAAGWTAAQLRSELDQPLARVLVWHEEGQVLGHALGWTVAGEVHIHEIAVAQQAQRRGIGRALVHALIQTCGGGIAMLELRASNSAALALYRSCGFETVGRRQAYYPDGEDAVLMTREPRGS